MVRRAGVPASRGGAAAARAVDTRDESPSRFVTFSQSDSAASLPEPASLPRRDLVFQALANSERDFRTLIGRAADGILVVDGNGIITLANSRSCEMIGYGPEEILGLDLFDTYLPAERDLGRLHLAQMPAGTVVRFERLLRLKDGSSLPIEVSVNWLPDGERQSIMRDVSARRLVEDELRRLAQELEGRLVERTREFEHANAALEATNMELGAANAELQSLLREQERLQAELAYRAMHDPLTGLANRIMFGERLDHALRVAERGAAVVWIDLDDFKEVNDIFGHNVGDEMLVAVADRLREVVRETDDIARMGGDEFAVILPNVIEVEAQMVAERILGALTDSEAFRLQMGASVGMAWQRTRNGDALELVRRADEAMYRAKTAGGGMAVMY